MKRKYLEPIRHMPELKHTLDGQAFDLDKSEVANWIAAQPGAKLTLFDVCRENKLIIYDPIKKTWKGNPCASKT